MVEFLRDGVRTFAGVIWRKLDVHNSKDRAQYKHLMWALYFLKVYVREEDNSNFSDGLGGKKFRKWAYIISFLKSAVC